MARDIHVVKKAGPERGDGRVRMAEPTSTEEARTAIERTRGRISATLDALEDRVEDQRAQLRKRLNVLRPVREQIREHRWRSLGIAFGAGTLLGLLGGVGGERPRHVLDAEERKELRRWRNERRERLRQRERPARRRRGAGLGLGRIPRVLAGALAAGFMDRVRQRMRRGGAARAREAPPRVA